MQVHVTGGCGFIGSHVVDRLVDAGHRVVVLDLRAPHRADVGHIAVDINDLDGLIEATRGADVVFHLAAFADVNDVAADPVGAVEANVSGTAKVWEACRHNGVGRAVLASTVWVYSGASGTGTVDETTPFQLDGAGHLYTSSKLAAELLVHSYHDLYGQEFTILRYGIPYGPRMRDALVIPRFVGMALSDEPITIHGDGSQYRNYVYVEDLAEAHVLALGPAGANEVFNLEGGEPISVRHLVDCIAEVLERPVRATYTDARAGDYAGRQVSAEKAERVLGWAPRVSFADGLSRYIDWHLERAQSAVAPEPAPALVAAAPRVPAVASVVDGLAAASLAVPALVVGGDAGLPGRMAAIAGTVAAVATAWLAARHHRPRLPAVLAFGIPPLVMWLLAQTGPGPICVPIGLLLGLTVGDAIARAPASRQPATVAAAAATGVSALGVTAALAHGPASSLLYWLGALLASAMVAQVAASYLRQERPRIAWRWRLVTATAALTVTSASWVGASSAGADWFGSVVSHGSRRSPNVALTFEGRAAVAPEVVAALDEYGTKATFFEPPEAVANAPDTSRQLIASGNVIANSAGTRHAEEWLDPRYPTLRRSQRIFARSVGVCPTFVRPSDGRHTPLISRAAHRHAMTIVTWDVRIDADDHEDPAALARRVLGAVRPGSIVALRLGERHDPGASAAEVRLILSGLQARRLTPVGLDELLHTPAYRGHC